MIECTRLDGVRVLLSVATILYVSELASHTGCRVYLVNGTYIDLQETITQFHLRYQGTRRLVR